jgi:saccharopine dehydrogenase-like NADP-dependent oxidoreductase
MEIKKIVVLGIGKIGHLVATLLKDSGFEVCAIDANQDIKMPFKVICGDVSDAKFLEKHIAENDAIVSCLPYFLNKNVVKIAHKLGVHYFDLTEDVQTADYIQKLSPSAKAAMVPQCGLAPGFIAIVGHDLAQSFKKIHSLELRVGALPESPKGDLGYAFNWSAEGVVNEYLNDCEIISNGQIKQVPAMQDLETIVIGGKTLEAFTTSGGLGTMCQTYEGKLDALDYKTIRYPGHMKLMRFFFHELMMKNDRIHAGEILVNAKPPVNNDVVYVYAACEGEKEKYCRDEFVKAYYPQKILGEFYTAISWTTACSICAIIELVASGKIEQKGFIKQEDIDLKSFLGTKNGGYYES